MVLADLSELRRAYLDGMSRRVLAVRGETVNLADISSRGSSQIGSALAELVGGARCHPAPSGQTVGTLFSELTRDFLAGSFSLLQHLRPGEWQFGVETSIATFEQYAHLLVLDRLCRENHDLNISLGTDYLVKPDIVVFRYPISDEQLEGQTDAAGLADVARYTSLRATNHQPEIKPILHASISCKWTMRSDRAQNTRTEALNLMRNRKGKTPHIVAVTAEPLPTRIASLALGTGDLDCVYHMALHELLEAVRQVGNEDQLDMLETMIDGKRLRDISDLPFDLVI